MSIIVLISIPLFAQREPLFEAASVRRTDQCKFQYSADPGMINFNGFPLNLVLKEAFQVGLDQILGPSWIGQDCFQISAKLANSATKDQVPTMLQSLLADRFALAFHEEVRLRSGYALVVDKNGPKMKVATPTFQSANNRAGAVRFGSTTVSAGIKGPLTMATLARLLSTHLKQPVEDLTGLTDKYDVDLSWALDRDLDQPGPYAQSVAAEHPPNAEDANMRLPAPPTADIFGAVRNSLGLRLEPRKQPVDFFVIDHIDRTPVEN